VKNCYLLFILLACCFSQGWPGQPVTVAIVPLDFNQTEVLDFIASAINSCYYARVSTLPVQGLPPETFYQPRQRYRAEKILDHLETNISSDYQKVLGITGRDISTTKGDIYDWGIFGLGSLNGRVCVVSTFRLKGKARHKLSAKRDVYAATRGVEYAYNLENYSNRNILKQRIAKVVNHELGHTFGLDHCSNYGCLMEDAGGGIEVVDRENGLFCKDCRKKLGDIVK
jgi:archaemetzincin